MKVAILTPSLTGGGAEHVAVRWGAGLSHLAVDVTLILTHGNVPDDPVCETRKLSTTASGFLPRIAALRNELNQHHYDAIVSLMPYCNLLALLANTWRRNSRTLTIISEHTIHAELNRTDRLAQKIQWSMARLFYRFADACVAVSHPAAADITASCGMSSARIWVVPNPAAEGVSRPLTHTDTERYRDSIAVVVASRLVRQKRLNLAIEAAHRVQEETGKRVRVEFFGTGPEEEALREMAEGYGIEAVFHGWVNRWHDHIPEDGIVLSTSRTEGFGNVLVEAAARSVPAVVSSKALGVADACIPNVTAKLVMGNSSDDYAKGLVAASRMIIPDVTTWLDRFTDEHASSLLMHVIEESSIRRPHHCMKDLNWLPSSDVLSVHVTSDRKE